MVEVQRIPARLFCSRERAAWVEGVEAQHWDSPEEGRSLRGAPWNVEGTLSVGWHRVRVVSSVERAFANVGAGEALVAMILGDAVLQFRRRPVEPLPALRDWADISHLFEEDAA